MRCSPATNQDIFLCTYSVSYHRLPARIGLYDGNEHVLDRTQKLSSLWVKTLMLISGLSCSNLGICLTFNFNSSEHDFPCRSVDDW